jgi:hypothetical protein
LLSFTEDQKKIAIFFCVSFSEDTFVPAEGNIMVAVLDSVMVITVTVDKRGANSFCCVLKHNQNVYFILFTL